MQSNFQWLKGSSQEGLSSNIKEWLLTTTALDRATYEQMDSLRWDSTLCVRRETLISPDRYEIVARRGNTRAEGLSPAPQPDLEGMVASTAVKTIETHRPPTDSHTGEAYTGSTHVC